MSNYLEILLSTDKDPETVRFLELNKGQDISGLLVCALEYNIRTQDYLKIGRVCINNLEAPISGDKIRKAIYVPKNSVIWDWTKDLKAKKRGLMTIKIRRILKESLYITDKPGEEYTEDLEECILRLYDLSSNKTVEPPKERRLEENRLEPRPTTEGNSNLMDSLMPPAM